jgi:Domain of unknown function (DUF4926)
VIGELDIVVLTTDLPDEGLRAGDLGAVVAVYQDGAAYEVEFVTLKGTTVSVVTVPSHGLRTVDDRDLPAARRTAVA